MLNKRLGAAISAVFLSIGCSGQSSPPPQQPPPAASSPAVSTAVSDSNQQIAAPANVDTMELAAMRTADGKVSRSGPELRIQLVDGRIAVLVDDTTPGMKFGLPRYAGYLKAIHSHAVNRIPYEGSGAYILVDDSTGDSTIVFGMPVVSPDGTRFALTSEAGEAGYDRGLVEVWRMVGRKPENEFSYRTEQEPWEASDAVWRDSVTVDFIKNVYPGSMDKPRIKVHGRLTRIGTTWVLSESPH
jgi:hypothetical protein